MFLPWIRLDFRCFAWKFISYDTKIWTNEVHTSVRLNRFTQYVSTVKLYIESNPWLYTRCGYDTMRFGSRSFQCFARSFSLAALWVCVDSFDCVVDCCYRHQTQIAGSLRSTECWIEYRTRVFNVHMHICARRFSLFLNMYICPFLYAYTVCWTLFEYCCFFFASINDVFFFFIHVARFIARATVFPF